MAKRKIQTINNKNVKTPFMVSFELELKKNEKKIIIKTDLKTSNINLLEKADLTFLSILTKGWEGKKTLNFYFKGKNAKANCIFLIIGKNKNKFDFETISHHLASNTKANYSVKSVLKDTSEVNYHGNIIANNLAGKSDAYLAHHCLILSPHAKIKTSPSLEIKTSEVKVGHSASAGKVNEEILFYLESRGLGRQKATKMLIKGFLEADINKLEDEDTKEMILKEIEKSLK